MQKRIAAAKEGLYAQYALQARGSETCPFLPGTAVVHVAVEVELVRETERVDRIVGVDVVAMTSKRKRERREMRYRGRRQKRG